MFEWLGQIDPATLVAILFGGFGGSIGGFGIFALIKQLIKNKAERKAITDTIQECFLKVALPNNIKIDAVNSMKSYLSNVVPELKEVVKEQMAPYRDAMLLMLKIMANTAAANKLTDEEKAMYQQVYNYLGGVSTEVEV